MKINKHNILLVNYVLSLQKQGQSDISEQELADFIDGNLDQTQTTKVITALNASSDLMQQWVDIHQTLGNLQEKQVLIEKTSIRNKLFNFIRNPWLIPITAMAFGVMVFLPRMIQPSNQDIIDGIYQQWQPVQSQYEYITKGTIKIYEIDNQEDLFQASTELGLLHWQQFSLGNKEIEIPDLCIQTDVENCKSMQKLAVQLGKIQGIVESNCHKNSNQVFWNDLEKADTQIRSELKKLWIDFNPEEGEIDFEFCL